MPPKTPMSTNGLAAMVASWHKGEHVPVEGCCGGGIDCCTVIVVVWLAVTGGEPLSVAVKVTV